MAVQRARSAVRVAFALLASATLVSACVTPAEFEKVRVKVVKLERDRSASPTGQQGERIADLATEIERLSRELRKMQGRIEVAEHQARSALKESRATRQDAASNAVAIPGPGAEGTDPVVPKPPKGQTSAEVEAYRSAYAAWRKNDYVKCIEKFRSFLQVYPDSAYVDDGAYWMADCYFKSGDFKTAVLRFDDVVARRPNGNKAADALYRQGEALLRLGPNYANAAGKAFERVLKEYPNSKRVSEARRQLDLLGSG